MASGRLADYLGKGVAADRPATLSLNPEAIGLWYATDSAQWSAWDGAAWIENIMGGGSRAPAIQSVASAATVTPTFADDLVVITTQAVALSIANPTGTAIPGLGMVIRLKDNGTARAITWGSQYRGIGVTLPSTTVAGKTTYVAAIYNATDTTWDVVAVGTQA